MGNGLSALDTWAAAGGVGGARVGVGAAGAALGPQPARGNTNKTNKAERKRWLKTALPAYMSVVPAL